MTAATAFIRLNAVGMVYMLCLAVMVFGTHTLVARLWVVYVIIIALLAIAQVCSECQVLAQRKKWALRNPPHSNLLLECVYYYMFVVHVRVVYAFVNMYICV